MSEKETANSALSNLIEAKLQKLLIESKDENHSLNHASCLMIYHEIFNTCVEVFNETNVSISNEAMNYIAQQYYDSVLVNGQYPLDPNVFDKRASVKEIATKELTIIATILGANDMSVETIMEIRHRS